MTGPTIPLLRSASHMLPVLSIVALLAVCGNLPAQDWTARGGDAGETHYARLSEITKAKANKLQVAWTFHTGDLSDGTELPARSSFETTPFVVNGKMFITTPFSRVIALDPESGKQLWAFDPKIDQNMSYPLFANRGLAWWSDGTRHPVFLGTLDGRLFSLDTETGKPDVQFGNKGYVDLREGHLIVGLT